MVEEQPTTPLDALRSVTAPKKQGDEEGAEVGIIKSLSFQNYLRECYLRLKGWDYDYLKNAWYDTKKPMMNDLGINNMMTSLKAVSDNIQFGRYDEKQIPQFVYHFYRMNYPVFIAYHKEFELNEKNFNIIKDLLLFFPLSSFHNAWNAGHRNTVRGIVSENVQMKALGMSAEQAKSGFSFNPLNWFRRKG